MIIDKNTEFADATSVGTPNNSTVNVGSAIDLGVARDIGNGQPVYVVFSVDTAITSGGAATVKFQVASDATSSISTSTQTIHVTTGAIPVASLVAGYQVVVALPTEGLAYEQFLGVQVVEAAGQALTAGAISAFISLDPTGYKTYADASN
jgi:hypothetical protein